jgi:hypothetical protein
MQGGEVCGCVIESEVRCIGRKGFMVIQQFNSPRSGAHLAQPVNDARVDKSGGSEFVPREA